MGKPDKILVRAVYERDVKSFLKRLGLIEEVENGDISCHFCGGTITVESFGGILRKDGELRFFCDRIECYVKVLKERSKES